ncbi:MAG: NAD(P)H-quinone oxidoreductase [Planctomycetes bacterium]|nr:NAD(P)H-quinone oxidoreductase [Planctomycetota bacterium]
MRAILCDGPALRWGEVDDPAYGPGDLVVRVRATSVNRADLLQRAGRYPPPPGASPVLGLEAAGLVEAVGRDVVGWRPGDEVMALLAGGGYAERVAVDARHALPVPRAVGLPAAGGLMEVFVTAWLNLVELGRLAPGERVLIHGGAGGVGTAAVQVARALGADPWVTAGSARKLEACAALGAVGLVDHTQDDFVARLRAAGGAHLVLDCLGASHLARNLDALRDDGRLVVIGLQGGARGELPLATLLARRLTVIGSTLRALPAERKAALIARFRERAWPLFDDGDLRVVVDRVLPITAAEEAHRVVERSEHVGKVVLAVA